MKTTQSHGTREEKPIEIYNSLNWVSLKIYNFPSKRSFRIRKHIYIESHCIPTQKCSESTLKLPFKTHAAHLTSICTKLQLVSSMVASIWKLAWIHTPRAEGKVTSRLRGKNKSLSPEVSKNLDESIAISVWSDVVLVVFIVRSLVDRSNVRGGVFTRRAEWSPHRDSAIGAGAIWSAVRITFIKFVAVGRNKIALWRGEAEELRPPFDMLELFQQAMVGNVAWNGDCLVA